MSLAALDSGQSFFLLDNIPFSLEQDNNEEEIIKEYFHKIMDDLYCGSSEVAHNQPILRTPSGLALPNSLDIFCSTLPALSAKDTCAQEKQLTKTSSLHVTSDSLDAYPLFTPSIAALLERKETDSSSVFDASRFEFAIDSAEEYEHFLQFEKSNHFDLSYSEVIDKPINFPRSATGLSRSVTYVPGKGLMIHLKGQKRGLKRAQLGSPSAQGVVTLAMQLHTGALDAFKSMKVNNPDVNVKSLDVHHALKNFPSEFASGTVVSYINKEEKVGIFMPYVKGGDLYNFITNNSIDTATQISYGLQLAKALSHLHGLGYLHRDLKPDNMLLSSDKKTIILADFDLSVKKDSDERFAVKGNREYMAPEAFGYWLESMYKALCPEPQKTDTLTNISVGNVSVNLSQIKSTGTTESICDIIEKFRAFSGDKITEKSEVFSLGMNLYVMKHRKFCTTWPQNPDNTTDPYEKIICQCLQLHPDDRPTMSEVIKSLKSLSN